jgi:phosphoribosylformimino-5-aminoimidazole carboxamide ribotide isomerase
VTYAGGARALADLDLVRECRGGRVDLSIGSALDIFGGDVSYQQVVAWQRRQEQ